MNPGRRVVLVLAALSLSLVVFSGQALAYGYSYSYTVLDRGFDAELAFDLVKHDFSDVFPAASPRSTCGSELYVGLECDLVGVDDKGHIRVEEVGSRHFVVRSLSGHAEGANKLINFTLANNYGDPDDDWLHLEVTASGTDNTWQKIPLTKRGNRLFADTMWGKFADNIRDKVATYVVNNPSVSPPFS